MDEVLKKKKAEPKNSTQLAALDPSQSEEPHKV